MQHWTKRVIEQWRVSSAFRRAKRMVSKGQSTESIILFLKEKGFSQALTSFALSRTGIGDAATCKGMVIESEHWKAALEGNLAVQRAIDEYLDQD